MGVEPLSGRHSDRHGASQKDQSAARQQCGDGDGVSRCVQTLRLYSW